MSIPRALKEHILIAFGVRVGAKNTLFCFQPCISPRRFSLILVSSAWMLGALYAFLPATELWGRYKVMENGMRSVLSSSGPGPDQVRVRYKVMENGMRSVLSSSGPGPGQVRVR